ncbi:hypothetical protein BTS2_3692 [Bacillus sp. TS-2]|nr:hypothetical protein BTS2_3692 [Bacillus sp. TS-2]
MLDFWTGNQALPIYGFFIRAIIIYLYIFMIVKILGQRSMGSIDPLDFIFGVVIGDILGEPLTDGELPLTGPFAAAATIGCIHLSLSFIALKTPRFRRVIENEPLIIMKHGIILHEQLKKSKVTLESLLMGLRLNNVSDLTEVDYAIIEMNGQISVIKKDQYNPVTLNDMKQEKASSGYPKILIEDGMLVMRNIEKITTVEHVKEILHKKGYTYRDIFMMSMNEAGQVYISPKKSATNHV